MRGEDVLDGVSMTSDDGQRAISSDGGYRSTGMIVVQMRVDDGGFLGDGTSNHELPCLRQFLIQRVERWFEFTVRSVWEWRWKLSIEGL